MHEYIFAGRKIMGARTVDYIRTIIREVNIKVVRQ